MHSARHIKFWISVLRGFGFLSTTLAVFLILDPAIWIWLKEGFSGGQDLLSPFNIVNWKLVVITLTPGIAALSLAKRLSQKRKTDKLPQTPSAPELRTDTETEEVVRRYRKIMVDDATSLGCVADERKLPDSKERIKKALLLSLAEEEDEQAREHLKAGYILLANFQPGAGEENVGIHGAEQKVEPFDFLGAIEEREQRLEMEPVPKPVEPEVVRELTNEDLAATRVNDSNYGAILEKSLSKVTPAEWVAAKQIESYKTRGDVVPIETVQEWYERTKVVTQSDVYEKWRPIVDKEFEELVNDLRKLGYWRD